VPVADADGSETIEMVSGIAESGYPAMNYGANEKERLFVVLRGK
jgi:hypothetical protein